MRDVVAAVAWTLALFVLVVVLTLAWVFGTLWWKRRAGMKALFVVIVAFWMAAVPVAAAVTDPQPSVPFPCSRWYWPLC